MTIKNSIINITFKASTIGILSKLAEHEDKPIAKLVRELTLEALEIREDLYLSQEAKKLDKKGIKTYGHDEAWK